mmetsp:Transcript_18210/g.37883  ORF Transcript_18210/g.37883 Transcript_18210/m.37883 type:complete len:258 (-) Transcript_18210:222-995(-)
MSLQPTILELESRHTRLFKGAAAAAAVAVPLSLGVTVIDRSVTLVAAGQTKLSSALLTGVRTVFRTPLLAFLGRDNRAVYGVYSSTYITKNVITITSSDNGYDSKWPMFVGTSLVNGSLGIMKDKYLAKMFGNSGGCNFPLASYASFLTRDAILIGVSFVVAPSLVPTVESTTGFSPTTANIVTQISVPAFAQLLATPVHLAGLDFYNRPEVGFSTRVRDAIRQSRGPILARMFRQGYVFGFGSLCVTKVTNMLLET